jgi:tRNA(Arg) A34 adenosine deaminase TadA
VAPEKAEAGFDDGGCRIGSVLARDGGVVSQGRNQPVQGGNPTVLEQMEALRKAGRQKTYRAITQCNLFASHRSVRNPAYLRQLTEFRAQGRIFVGSKGTGLL